MDNMQAVDLERVEGDAEIACAVLDHSKSVRILITELFRIESNGIGVDVSAELRALLLRLSEVPPVAAGSLFETGPSKTSEESAAL